MKKWLSMLLAAIMLSTMLSGCAQTEDPEGSGTTAAPSETEPFQENNEPADAPLAADGEPMWIWSESSENNQWVYFRKEFTLTDVPDAAPAIISAADKYWLYINDTLVVLDGSLKRGDTPETGYYDTVDLAPYLQQGKNTVAVQAWFWGRREEGESTSHAFVDQGGFLLSADIGDGKLVTDSSWRVYRETAFINETRLNPAPRSCLPEYDVYYDSTVALTGNWKAPDYEEAAGWTAATECGKLGDAPYNELVARPIPMFAFGELQDFEDSAQWLDHKTSGKEDIKVTLPYNAQFTPYLRVSTSRSVKIVIQPNNYKQSNVIATFVTNGEGEQEFEIPAWMNGDSVTFSMPGGVTILDLKFRETSYDTEILGEFTAEDTFLNDLWTMAVRTQLVCMRDTFMDCPDRERAQWWGDTANQIAQVLYTMDADAWLLYEKGLTQKLGWMHDGAFQTIVPSEENSELPSQELGGIIGTWNYYLYTGRQNVLEQMYDAYLGYLQKWELRDDGLVDIRLCNWSEDFWYDSLTYSGEDRLVLENAWYYWAVRSVANMAEVIGKDASWLDERAASIAAAFDAAFWTKDGYWSGDVETPDDRANAIAVLSGLASEAHYPAIRQVLMTTMQCGTFMESYVLQALCEMGYINDALTRMKERYSPMVEYNLENHITTLWEYWEREAGTENHAWSSGPIVILEKYVAGIRPTSVGYDTYAVTPYFAQGQADTIHVTVPTGKGNFILDGTLADGTCQMNLVAPEGCTSGTLAVPRLATVTINGETVYSGNTPADNDSVTFTSADDQYLYFTVIGTSFDITASE